MKDCCETFAEWLERRIAFTESEICKMYEQSSVSEEFELLMYSTSELKTLCSALLELCYKPGDFPRWLKAQLAVVQDDVTFLEDVGDRHLIDSKELLLVLRAQLETFQDIAKHHKEKSR